MEITLTDADGVTSLLPATVAVGVLPPVVIELPLTVTPVGAPIHTIGKPPVKLISSVLIANADDGKLTGATVVIAAGRLTGDKLSYTAPADNPIQVTRPNDWTVTLSGLATVEQYAEALKAISFSATQVGLTRTVTITIAEQDGDTSPLPGVVFANTIAPLPPTVTVLSLPPTYTLGKQGVKVAPIVKIADLDSTSLTGATVKITGGRQPGDLLAFSHDRRQSGLGDVERRRHADAVGHRHGGPVRSRAGVRDLLGDHRGGAARDANGDDQRDR